MAKITLAWELGGNLGHLLPLSRLAQALSAAGHSVDLIFKDVSLVSQFFQPRTHRLLQAPTWRHRGNQLSFTPASMAEIVAHFGYTSKTGLNSLITSWLDSFALLKSDLIIMDFAPSARLAARIAGISCINVGSGFQLLPPNAPCENLRPDDQSVTWDRLQNSERQVLGTANSVLANHGVTAIDHVADLFNADLNLITSIAELDHYPQRHDGHYRGPLVANQALDPVTFQSARPYKVFMYLQLSTRQLQPLFNALKGLDVEVIACCPNIDSHFDSNGIQGVVSKRPLDISPIAAQSDLLICHGGHSLTTSFLLAGCPVLALPQQLEQQLLGRLKDQQFGDLLNIQDLSDQFSSRVEQLLTQLVYKTQVAKLQSKYQQSDALLGAPQIVGDCTSLLDGKYA